RRRRGPLRDASRVGSSSVGRGAEREDSVLLSFSDDPATTEIYTLSLHDALPIFHHTERREYTDGGWVQLGEPGGGSSVQRNDQRDGQRARRDASVSLRADGDGCLLEASFGGCDGEQPDGPDGEQRQPSGGYV